MSSYIYIGKTISEEGIILKKNNVVTQENYDEIVATLPQIKSNFLTLEDFAKRKQELKNRKTTTIVVNK